MSTKHPFLATRNSTAPRVAWRQMPAALRSGAVLAFLSGGTSLLLLSGCKTSPALSGKPQDVPGSSPVVQRPPSTNKKTDNRTAAWQATLSKWIQEASKPRTTTTKATTVRPVVSINITALASRHPAWRLADALERGGQVPVAVDPVQLSRIRRVAPVPFGPLQVAAPGGAASFYRGEQRVEVDDLVRLQVQTRIKQDRAINDFIVDVANRQRATRSGEANTLRAALEEDVAAARRLNLAELQPALPPDPIQLEMTNLRLDLLRNVHSTPQAKEQAIQRLRVLEAEWEAKLRSQEAQRLAELERVRTDRPLRVRREGEARIRATLNEIRRRDAATREAVVQSHRARLVEDLTADEARLGIVLPAASLPAQSLPSQSTPPSSSRIVTVSERPNINKTLRTNPTSKAYQGTRGVSGVLNTSISLNSSSQRAAQIRALRAQAWSDARRWARSTALREGWRWNETTPEQNRTTVPDRTEAVLRILNLS